MRPCTRWRRFIAADRQRGEARWCRCRGSPSSCSPSRLRHSRTCCVYAAEQRSRCTRQQPAATAPSAAAACCAAARLWCSAAGRLCPAAVQRLVYRRNATATVTATAHTQQHLPASHARMYAMAGTADGYTNCVAHKRAAGGGGAAGTAVAAGGTRLYPASCHPLQRRLDVPDDIES